MSEAGTNTINGPEKLDGRGIAIRLVHDEEKDRYRVEQSPILSTGEIDGDWNVFGGTIGYKDTEYTTEKEAREFYRKVRNKEGSDVLVELAVGENQ